MTELQEHPKGKPGDAATGVLGDQGTSSMTAEHLKIDRLAHKLAPILEGLHGDPKTRNSVLSGPASKEIKQAFIEAERKGDPKRLAADLTTHLRQIPGHERDTVHYNNSLGFSRPDRLDPVHTRSSTTIAEYDIKETLAKRNASLPVSPEALDNQAKSIAGMIKANPDNQDFHTQIAALFQAAPNPWDLEKRVNDYFNDNKYQIGYGQGVTFGHSVGPKRAAAGLNTPAK